MRKRKSKVFIVYFLFLGMCSSILNVVAKPMDMKEEIKCIEEHKHREGCYNITEEESSKESEDKFEDIENNLGDENGKPKGEPIIRDIETNKEGKITVSNKILEWNKVYVLVETKAPENYIADAVIVFYIKGGSGPYPNGEGIVVIEDGGTLEVLNTKEGEMLPATGGEGTGKIIFI
ncbi:MAG: prealbumin-like fold domain-containing protein [Clostridium sp.]